MDFRIEHIFDAPPEKVWELVWDEGFAEELKEALKLEEYATIEKKEEKDTIIIKRKVTPKVAIPGTIKKFVGDKISYIEENRIKKGTFSFTWEIKLNTLGDKVDAHGKFWIEPYGTNGAKRIIEGTIKVKISGVGKTIEKMVLSGIKENYDKASELMKKKLAEA